MKSCPEKMEKKCRIFFHQQNVPLAIANSELKQNRAPWKTENAHLDKEEDLQSINFGIPAVSFLGV